jgi:hypothetical protein
VDHREDVPEEDRCHFLIGFRGSPLEVDERIGNVRADEEVESVQELVVVGRPIVERVSAGYPEQPSGR